MGGVMLGVLWGAATQSWFSYGYICAIAINTFYTAKKKKKKGTNQKQRFITTYSGFVGNKTGKAVYLRLLCPK